MSKASLSINQILSIRDSHARMNFWIGAVRSGKTFASILRFIDLLRSPMKGDAMICGVSRGSIQRNIIKDLFGLLGWPMPTENKSCVNIFGRNVHLIGAKDERAVSVIQGVTLGTAYIDELPRVPKPFFKMLQSRCSVPDAKILATGNPEGPFHWLKKEYIDSNVIDIKVFKFTLEDNPSLDEKYKQNITKEYTGVWYKRFILGEWAAADGLVYDCFNENHVYDTEHHTPAYYIAGIDYGTSNATCCVLAAIYPKGFTKIRIVKEYYYDSRVTGRGKTDSELAVDIYGLLKCVSNLRAVYVDPSALSFKLELDRKGLPVQDADNDVTNGIKTVSNLLHNNQLSIHESCRNLIESLYSYIWDDKAAQRGEDAPKKEFDHGADALRYAIYSEFPQGEIEDERESWTVDKWKREMKNFDPMELLLS